MASIKKYHPSDVSHFFDHNNRAPGDGIKRSNESIDASKTYLNYYLTNGNRADLNKRLSEVFSVDRADQVILVEAVVTLPKDVKPEDERKFFRAVFDFYSKEFGEKNVIDAVVHKDETTPHIHIALVPVVEEELTFETRNKDKLEKWKAEHGIKDDVCEHLCGSDKVDQEYLKKMHPRLRSYVSAELGYEVSILNGATLNGNKKVIELKIESLKEQVEILERQRANMLQEIEVMRIGIKNSGLTVNDLEIFPLVQKIIDLENQNAVYKGIVEKHSLAISTADIERIKEKKYIPSLSVNLNVYDGQLTNADIAEDGVVIIELFDRQTRPLPQQTYIDSNRDLQDKIRAASKFGKQPITVKKSSVSSKDYVFIRADDTRQTLLVLLEFQEFLKKQYNEWKNRHLYMERMEFDTFDVAKSILKQSGFTSSYYTGRQLGNKDGLTKDQMKDGYTD